MSKKTRRKIRKVLTMLCCALLLVAVSVGATFAYLTSQDQVTNTFTVGNGIKITLDEAAVEQVTAENAEKYSDYDLGDYVDSGAPRVKENSYHLHPGVYAKKDPTIKTDPNNDPSWIVAKIVVSVKDEKNTIEALRNAIGENGLLGFKGIVNGGVLAETYTGPVVTDGVAKWTSNDYVLTQEVVGDTNVFYVYFQKQIEADKDLVIFDNITIPEDWSYDKTAALKGLKMDVYGYAVQTEGFGTVEEAFAAAFPNA